jgi:hypothetical protein
LWERDRERGKLKHFHWRGERETAFEQDFVEDILGRAAITNVVDVQFELLLQRGHIASGNVRIPGLKVGLSELEDSEATVR